MNNEAERIINLAQLLGIDTTEGSESMAELKGYAVGLRMISQDMMLLENQLSPLTAEGSALKLFCNMFSIPHTLGTEEKRQLIIERYSRVFGDYEPSGMINEMSKYGITPVISDNVITINQSVKNTDFIENLGAILKNYLFPGSIVLIAGADGFDFDYWDDTERSFDDYDRLDLPFYILDQFR